MGLSQPSSLKLPSLPKQHWQEVPLPSNPTPKLSHGNFKLFRNVLTNQQIQQYSITFRSNVQFLQYIECFRLRIRNDNFVNGRYIDYEDDNNCCSQLQTVKIYMQHIPLRLSHIQDIPQPENLYVLMAALQGFQKLYGYLGYFKTNQDMIGIDKEGRIKVWLNSDFSKNYLYGPYYIEGIVDPLTGLLQKQGEQTMVWDIVKMIEQNTTPQIFYPVRISQFFIDHRGSLSFITAKSLVRKYAKKYHIIIPTYFQSILRIFDQGKQAISEEGKSRNKIDDSKSFKKIVHYVDPAEESSQDLNSMVNLTEPINNPNMSFKRQERSQIKLTLPSVVRSGQTTDESLGVKARSFNQFKGMDTVKDDNSVGNIASNSKIPQVHFRYQSYPNSPKNLLKDLMNQSPSVANNPTPINEICEQNHGDKSLLSHRLTYSNAHQDYELDEQMVQDMLRYKKG